MKKQVTKSRNSFIPVGLKAPVKLENPLNQDNWYCNDLSEVYSVDGIDYIKVFKKDTPHRTNLMRKSALQKVV